MNAADCSWPCSSVEDEIIPFVLVSCGVGAFLYSALLCLLFPSAPPPPPPQFSSPLLCGPVPIIQQWLHFAIMSPHLWLVVCPSQFPSLSHLFLILT